MDVFSEKTTYTLMDVSKQPPYTDHCSGLVVQSTRHRAGRTFLVLSLPAMYHVEVCIPVEVQGEYGEFYPGLISGLNSLEDFKVHLLDTTHSKGVVEISVPPSSLRLPPENSGTAFEPVQGQEVDVLIGSSTTESSESEVDEPASPKLSAWWPATIKKIGGGFVMIELLANLGEKSSNSNAGEIRVRPDGRVCVPPSSIEKTDIVEKHQLRLRSCRTSLSSSSFHVHAIDIPDALAPYCKEPVHYHHFAKRCGLPVLICLAPDSMRPTSPIKGKGDETYNSGTRLLVVSTEASTVHRASVIDNTFIDMLRQKVSILQQTEELSRKLEATRLNQMSPFSEEFTIPIDLTIYAIGAQGSNIRRANAIDGVISIKLDRQTGIIRILGKTKESVAKARELLEFSQEVVQIPISYMGPILGPGHRRVQQIVDRVGLIGIKISPTPESDPSYVSFKLTGTRQAVCDTRLFFEFQVASLQELDRLRGVEDPPSIIIPKISVAEISDNSNFEETPNQPSHNQEPPHNVNHQLTPHQMKNGDQAFHENSDEPVQRNTESNPGNETSRNNQLGANMRQNHGNPSRPRPQMNHNSVPRQGMYRDMANQNYKRDRNQQIFKQMVSQPGPVNSDRQNISVPTYV